MKPVRTKKAAVVLVSGFVLLGLAGCAAGARSPQTPPNAEVAGASAGADPVEAQGTEPGASPAASPAEGNAPPATDGSPAEIEPGEAADPNPAASAAGNAAEAVAETKTGRGKKKGVGRSICRQKGGVDEELIDEAHRKLYETLCGAALWFDGLFGERNEATIASARGVSGRLEISGLNSDYEGSKFRVRGNVRFDFPNLDRRWNAFVGRDDRTTSSATAPRGWPCARSFSTSRTRTAGSPGSATRCREPTSSAPTSGWAASSDPSRRSSFRAATGGTGSSTTATSGISARRSSGPTAMASAARRASTSTMW